MQALRLSQRLCPFVQSKPCLSRTIATSIVRLESNLSLLRKKTGLTFVLCKKALDANNGDLKQAEEWLKEEVKRAGLDKSQKMTYRTANEGLVGVYIDQLKKNGVILEVNCETDFVAKNNKFKELVSKLTKDFATVPQVEERRVSNSIQKYVLSADRIPTENEHISEAVTHLGEKIRIKRACFIKNHYDDPSISLVGYAHSTEGLNNHLGDVTFGKYATIVALKQLPSDSSYVNETAAGESSVGESSAGESSAGEPGAEEPDEIAEPLDFDTAAKQICQHIIVAAPERVRRDPTEQARSEANEEKRTESAEDETSAEQATQLPKQPTVLVEQEFLHSDYERVDDFLRFNNLEVVDFIRIKCGESSD